MKSSRREFLKVATATGIATMLPWRRVYAYGRSPTLRKFVQALPGLGPSGIPVAAPDLSAYPGHHYYRLAAGEYAQRLHPDLPNDTRLWGYADLSTPTPVFRHLGPLIVAHRGIPVRLTLTNQLPDNHLLPVDTSLPGAELAANRVSLHLHGGHTPWISDGGPFAWFAPAGAPAESAYGPSAVSAPDMGDMGTPAPGTFDYYYPNDVGARLLWYHDHALGITRLNAYAGLASGYVLRDNAEASLIQSGAIPSNELPLIIQDKIFKTAPDQWGQAGDLWYPSEYETDRWDLEEGGSPLPLVSCVPEFFGDTMLVNGIVFPSANVEQRSYRLRVLNACNSRFCTLRLFYAQGAGFPRSAEADLRRAGPPFIQIGNEGGFLPAPVVLDGSKRSTLLLAPGERADLIVDFSDVPTGSTLILYNDAAAPYPNGSPDDDHYATSRSADAASAPGFGPDTRTLLQFVVGPRVGPKDAHAPLVLPPLDPAPLVPIGVMTLPPGVPVRDLTLNEDVDEFGRLKQGLGTAEPLHTGTLSRDYMDPATETPVAGAIEVWRVFNRSADTHPIHFHLVNVQVVSRQAFDVRHGRFLGPARPPDLNEQGWKDTVRMNPGDCTTVIMKFDLADTPFLVPPSPRTGGHEYVWHCHILEHEEHDMMRPLIVMP
jgi:spore coat protein A, manganese oxidase